MLGNHSQNVLKIRLLTVSGIKAVYNTKLYFAAAYNFLFGLTSRRVSPSASTTPSPRNLFELVIKPASLLETPLLPDTIQTGSSNKCRPDAASPPSDDSRRNDENERDSE